jgi:hypothetical protein
VRRGAARFHLRFSLSLSLYCGWRRVAPDPQLGVPMRHDSTEFDWVTLYANATSPAVFIPVSP